MYKFGIDPGCSGAIVFMHGDELIEWMLMPTYKIGTATKVNPYELGRWIDKCTQDYVGNSFHAYIEAVHAMPGNGATSMFNFGHACGTVVGSLGALGIPMTFVTPQQWKKSSGLIGTDKDAARSRAIGLWPKWSDLSKKGKGQALADAALIAKYGETP